MPINAGPEYGAAERKYNEAKTIPEKIKALEGMLRVAPSHKGAEVLRAGIKSKISKLKHQLEKERTSKKSGHQYMIKRDGAAQVVICGLTNSGKSYLLSKLTNAKPAIASYEFTTKMPEVGVLDYYGVKIQVIEIPAITENFIDKENGAMFFSIIRNADLVVFVVRRDRDSDFLKSEFEKANIRLGKKKPNVVVKKQASGGINVVGNIKIPYSVIVEKCMNYSIYNAIIEFYDDVSLEDFVNVLSPATVFMPHIVVGNNLSEFDLDNIKGMIWKKLGLIRVYTKMPGKERDYPPVAMRIGSTIKDLAMFIHKDFLKNFRFARVWGSSKFPGQALGLDYMLKDNDVVELHMK